MVDAHGHAKAVEFYFVHPLRPSKEASQPAGRAADG